MLQSWAGHQDGSLGCSSAEAVEHVVKKGFLEWVMQGASLCSSPDVWVPYTQREAVAVSGIYKPSFLVHFRATAESSLRRGGEDSFAAGGGHGQVAPDRSKEAAVPVMCPQCPGSESQGKGGDWTWHHTVAFWPQPSFSRVELLEG